jgi:hypothetical protein
MWGGINELKSKSDETQKSGLRFGGVKKISVE